MMNDAVFWGSIVAVSLCLAVFIGVAVYVVKKINTDNA